MLYLLLAQSLFSAAMALRLDRLHLLKLRLHLQFYQGNLFPLARNKQEASSCLEYGWPGKMVKESMFHKNKQNTPQNTNSKKKSCNRHIQVLLLFRRQILWEVPAQQICHQTILLAASFRHLSNLHHCGVTSPIWRFSEIGMPANYPF